MTQKNKVVTGKVRFSYVNVFEPRAVDGQDPKYSTSLIIPKSDKKTVQRINAAIEEATTDGLAKFGGKRPTGLKTPLRDGDAERPDDPTYKNAYFLNANSRVRPGLVDGACNPITDRDLFYSGCFGRASITFYAYNTNGNRGIACGLQNLQKLEDGERLGGRSLAEDDFQSAFEDDFLS
jgi:hypothetical protein